MIFARFDSQLGARFYDGEQLAFELQLKDPAGAVENLLGRVFQLSLFDAQGVQFTEALGVVLMDETGWYVAFSLPGTASSLAATKVEPQYELAELLAGGERDPIVAAPLDIEPSIDGFTPAVGAGTLPDGPVSRITREFVANKPRVIAIQRGPRGQSAAQLAGMTPDQYLADQTAAAAAAGVAAVAPTIAAAQGVVAAAAPLLAAAASAQTAAAAAGAAVGGLTNPVRQSIVPGFGAAALAFLSITPTGNIVDASSSPLSAQIAAEPPARAAAIADATAFTPSVRIVPGAWDAGLSAIAVTKAGVPTSITYPIIGSSIPLPGTQRTVPGFGRVGALDARVGLDGVVSRVGTHVADRGPDFFFARNGIVPNMRLGTDTLASFYDPDEVILGVPLWGQSKNFGQNTDGDALISVTPRYPGKALMPSYGTHVAGRRFSDVADLISAPFSVSTVTAQETSLPALVNHFIAMHQAATGVQPIVLGGIAAYPAQTYDNLNRASPTYADLQNWLRDGRDYAARLGKVFIVPALFCQHGQNATDKYRHSDHYFVEMLQLQRTFAADVRAILGQGEPPVIMMTQVDAGVKRDLTASDWRLNGPARAQLELSRLPGFGLSHNEGCCPVGSDGLHETSEGYYRQGMAQGRALYREVCGTGQHAMRIGGIGAEVWRSSTVLDLEMAVPGNADMTPLADGASIVAAFDPAVKQRNGMQFADANGLIDPSGYSLAALNVPATTDFNARWLRVTFTSAPSKLLRYSIAMRTDDFGLGRTTIAGATTYTPLDTLPHAFPDRDFAVASYGQLPALG